MRKTLLVCAMASVLSFASQASAANIFDFTADAGAPSTFTFFSLPEYPADFFAASDGSAISFFADYVPGAAAMWIVPARVN